MMHEACPDLNRNNEPSDLHMATFLQGILKPASRAMTTNAIPCRIKTAACLIIGDEVLNGKIQDTNSNYVAKFCFDLGIDLRRVCVVPDEEEDIVSTLTALRAYDLVITSGGIGPTHDDITYESIAKSYGLPLAVDKYTVDRMNVLSKRKPKDCEPSVKAAQLRMATFPEGDSVQCHHLYSDLWVPVVSIENKVYILPGIPQLFQRLLDGLRPQLSNRIYGDLKKRRFISTTLPESVLAGPLREAQSKYGVLGYKLGSYPHMKLRRNTISVIGPSDEPRFDELVKHLTDVCNGHEISAEEEHEASFTA